MRSADDEHTTLRCKHWIAFIEVVEDHILSETANILKFQDLTYSLPGITSNIRA